MDVSFWLDMHAGDADLMSSGGMDAIGGQLCASLLVLRSIRPGDFFWVLMVGFSVKDGN